MKAQIINRGQTAQEYITVGTVFLAGGVMFVAGTQEVVGYAQWCMQLITAVMIVVGSVLLAIGASMRHRTAKAPARGKSTGKKRNGSKR